MGIDGVVIWTGFGYFRLQRKTMVSIAKVLLGVFGVAVVVVLITVPTVIFLREDQEDTSDQKVFSLEDVFNSTLKPKSFGMTWISDSEYLYRSMGTVYLKSITSDPVVFLSADAFNRVQAYGYQLSADRRYVAFMSNYTKLWRHSFTASYSLYDRNTNDFVTPADIPNDVQYFSWAPEGHKLAYVWRNNVYVKTSPTSAPKQVTFSGVENRIFNGHPDWVYEEEMFSSNQGLWWSPGGKYVAYIESNDTEVHTIEYTWYGVDQYPETVAIPYPKPGTPNPIVKLFIVDTDDTTDISEVAVSEQFSSSEYYLATVTWATDEKIAVQWLKRVQNHLILQIYSLNGTVSSPESHHEVKSATGWVGRFSPPEPVFAADKNSFYLLKSDTNGYKHIHHVTAGGETAITSGSWEVISILKVTADSVYYSSNEDGGRPGGRNVYKWDASGVKCLTCAVDAENCLYNSVYFSQDASFYRLSCSGPGIPHHSLWNASNDTEIMALETNQQFSDLISDIGMPTMRRDTIKLGKWDLWYQMYLPPGFDESKQYPLLIDVYAGPCSQKTDFIYRVGWSTYLASTENIIVASFDGRGSGYQGDELMHALYKRLGTYEVEDQITAAKAFIDMGFIDKDRVAIWGWSYGGYVTSMVLGAGSGVFKCGMAVAPVSKWKYYDTIYTERYMQEPSDNPNYDNSTVTERAKNFHSVNYLLIHGTADDNVHFQQAAEISEALVEEQVDFEAMWYTDKDHGLDGSANRHVYTHMAHFLKRCFE